MHISGAIIMMIVYCVLIAIVLLILRKPNQSRCRHRWRLHRHVTWDPQFGSIWVMKCSRCEKLTAMDDEERAEYANDTQK